MQCPVIGSGGQELSGRKDDPHDTLTAGERGFMCNRSKEAARFSLTFHHEIIFSNFLRATGRLQLDYYCVDKFDREWLDVFGFEAGVAECVSKQDCGVREPRSRLQDNVSASDEENTFYCHRRIRACHIAAGSQVLGQVRQDRH